jgi:hypothetical protein
MGSEEEREEGGRKVRTWRSGRERGNRVGGKDKTTSRSLRRKRSFTSRRMTSRRVRASDEEEYYRSTRVSNAMAHPEINSSTACSIRNFVRHVK